MKTKLENLIELAEQEVAYTKQLLNSYHTQEMIDVETVRLSCKQDKLKTLQDILFDYELLVLQGYVEDAKEVAKKYDNEGDK